MKYSIIIPVYNSEKYLDKCLTSILNQNYSNFEVIIVNDGSTDSSEAVIDKYLSDKRFIKINKKNSGVADTRNVGLSYVTGDYILFLDSDDTFNEKLLLTLSKYNDIDLIKYNAISINEDGNILKRYKVKPFSNLTKLESIKSLLTDDLIDVLWGYAYKTSFFKEYNFTFESGRVHEDFGLISYIILEAKSYIAIDFVGVNYLIREGSITNNKSSKNEEKKAFDLIYLYDKLLEYINKSKSLKEEKEVTLVYITDALIRKYTYLFGNLKKMYKNELRRKKIYKNIPKNTFKRYIKYIALLINVDLYLLLTGGFNGKD